MTSIYKRFAKDGGASRKPTTAGPYQRHAKGFMGETWDGAADGGVSFDPNVWKACRGLLKPGGHLIAFGGARTYHRMACAVEDAGFEVRDMIAWLYGSGFPKSHDAGDGWGTALKPAIEPMILARAPMHGTVAKNVLKHGTGAINIEACRIGNDERVNGPMGSKGAVYRTGCGGRGDPHTIIGRWPANLIHDGSEEVVNAFPRSDHAGNFPKARGRGGIGNDGHRGMEVDAPRKMDLGGADRFFYSAKADKKSRHGSDHPTVKPVDLMRYLCKLIVPPGGTVLDPFAGTGTTAEAAVDLGLDCILIEREQRYVEDVERRLKRTSGLVLNLNVERMDDRSQTQLPKTASSDADRKLGGQARTASKFNRSRADRD